MTNIQFTALAWIALLGHAIVGVLAWRHLGDARLLPVLNAFAAICVIAYWTMRWYGNISRGAVWYWTDQLVPLYAIVSLCAALMTLTGRMQVTWPNILVFVVNSMASVAAVLFVSTFRVNRLF